MKWFGIFSKEYWSSNLRQRWAIALHDPFYWILWTLAILILILAIIIAK